jgi:hypothetical protein
VAVPVSQTFRESSRGVIVVVAAADDDDTDDEYV